MKSKYVFIGLGILLVVTVLVVCYFVFIKRKEVEIVDIKKMEFSYTKGYAMNSDIRYNVECSDKCIVRVKPYEVPEEKTIKVEVDKKEIEKIQDVFKKYEVGKWDGFKSYDKNVLDGDSFHLYVTFDDDTRISASGYMKWPKNYGSVRDELDTIFMDMIKDEVITWDFINFDEEVWIEKNKEYNIGYYDDTFKVTDDNYELVIDGNKISGLDNDKFVINILDTRDDAIQVRISRKGD